MSPLAAPGGTTMTISSGPTRAPFTGSPFHTTIASAGKFRPWTTIRLPTLPLSGQ
jgi:hypothetical protein